MDKTLLQKGYDEALAGLAANCKMVPSYDYPVLFEGGCYQGIWFECAPLESIVYGTYAPQVARASHDIFFHHQRADDPAFMKRIPINSWGGATQALTALRTPRWFYHYNKSEDHKHLMTQWINAILRSDYFMQQINPWTGDFTESGTKDYSPSMLVLVDFVDRMGLLRA